MNRFLTPQLNMETGRGGEEIKEFYTSKVLSGRHFQQFLYQKFRRKETKEENWEKRDVSCPDPAPGANPVATHQQRAPNRAAR